MIRSAIVLSILPALFLFAEDAQTDRRLHDETDKVFSTWDSTISPGCALSVMKDGNIIYKRGYGMANLDHDVPITSGSVFHVASISKQFTAASIVLLVQEGKLSLDDDVHKYIPELPDFGVRITIRHLIHHTSGLRDQWELLGLAGWRYSLDLITDDDVMAVTTRQKELNFPPGEKYTYCNTGYTLLAQIVKRVSGQSLREFTTARIFGPLGMEHTHFRDDHAEIVKHIAYGYEGDNSKHVFRLSVTNFDTTGATSLLTTVEDLALWDENFYHPKVGGQALIDQVLQRGKLNNGKVLDYAFGLAIDHYRGLNIVDHSGADAGYRADLLRFPAQHFSVACLCNQAETNPSDLARKVADIYLADQFKEPRPASAEPSAKPVVVTENRLNQLAGLYWKQDEARSARLVQEKGKLVLEASGDDRIELSPLADNQFRLGTFPVTFTFEPAMAAIPLRLTAKRPGQEKPDVFERVTAFQPTEEQLRQYAGSYASAEIDPIYRIDIEKGSLVLKRLKAKPGKLRPMIRDYFEGPDGTLRFERSKSGDVTGFALNSGRIKNFRFTKTTLAALHK